VNPVRNSISGNRITHPRIKHGLKEKTTANILSNGMKIVACIPARFSSTRFPGKVLAKDTGKFLIQHVYEQACQARLIDRVIIAADDRRIVDAAESFGAECVLTSVKHQSGTDRIAEAVKNVDADIVVNLQADEPEIDPANIDYLARLLLETKNSNLSRAEPRELKTQNRQDGLRHYGMATLAAPFDSAEQIADPNIVKVVVTSIELWHGLPARENTAKMAVPPLSRDTPRAIYFSRSPIPYDREKIGIGEVGQYLRHIGIYAYRKGFLLKITSLPQTPLEKIEKLEQLRAIENGFGILVGKVKHTCDGIDTPQQYAEFVKRYKNSHRGF
jgi:3-deoxy-manno-octulosonate cytidylyltransferase (CMP-KDO synthetase)